MKKSGYILTILLVLAVGSLVAQHHSSGISLDKTAREITRLDGISMGLRLLVAADHTDRLQTENRGRLWRDKLRMAIVQVWYEKGWINQWPDQYAAGYILMRAGQPEIDQPKALAAAYQLFSQVALQTDHPVIQAKCIFLMEHISILLEQPDTLACLAFDNQVLLDN